MGNFKRTMVTLLACLTVLCLSIGFFPWATLTKTASADTATQADGYDLDGNGTIEYVAFGDSMSNGYGQPDYYLRLQKHEKEHHEYRDGECYLPDGTLASSCLYAKWDGKYVYTTELWGGNSFGYLVNAAEAYPTLVSEALEEEYGKNVNLLNMAISGMRVEELRMLLDRDYMGDGYTRKLYLNDSVAFPEGAEPRFDWAYGNAYAGGYSYQPANTTSIKVENNAEVKALYDAFLRDYQYYDENGTLVGDSTLTAEKGIAKVAAQYQYAIKNAEVISIALGTNNFGTGSQPAIYRTLQQLFGVTLGDTTDYLYDLDGLLAEYPTMVNYAKGIQEKLHGVVLKILGQEAHDKYLPAVEDIVNTYTYGLIGFIANYKVVLDKIHALNPNVKIVLVGAMNMEAGLVFDFNGVTVNFGQLYGTVIEAANLWLNNYACTLNENRGNENIVYSQTETVELIIDEVAQGIWNDYILSYMTKDFEDNLGIAGFGTNLAKMLNALGMKYDYILEEGESYDLADMDLLADAFVKLATVFAPDMVAQLPPLTFARNEKGQLYAYYFDGTTNQYLTGSTDNPLEPLIGLLQGYDTAMQLLTAMEASASDHHVDLVSVAGLFANGAEMGALLSDPTKYYLSTTQDFLYFFARMMFASGAGVHPSANGHRVVANEIINTLINNVTAADRFEEKIEIIKTTYVTAVREAIANTFSSEVVGTIDAIGKWFNNNGYDKKVIEYAFKLQAAIDNNTPNAAQQVIADALAEIQSIKAEAIAPESYTVNENSYYVSIGDSQITGHGLPGYENYGYNTYVEGAAPYELAKA
ncbi:MAG: hypothetical protein IKL77_04455, partial [Clostridia bacterium]|nr:hypothetical protein [Clostridia bacterium]